ncbi:MAG: SRPBCC domain-containing protein [Actinobacteria bacterium]|nr:SRPBCC domain-containing protein [Actinomycetota bacterium]
MVLQLFRKKKELTFERTYAAPIGAVWEAWTDPDQLRQWWGPPKTTIAECELDLRVGGRIAIVMVAGEGMGKYQGTRWPMEGTFTDIEFPHRLVYDARSWTEGKEDTTTIEHVTELGLSEDDGKTVVNLTVTLNEIGSGAKMAAFGMKWGYKAQLDELDTFLAG